MKPVTIIVMIVVLSVVSVFVISEIIWYFANQEFEKARDELKENLAEMFEKQYGVSPKPPSEINCSGNARCFTGTVTKVTDGDTINVDNQAIRFALASAPELNEFRGQEAKDFINSVCPVGSTALVDEDDGQTEGSYGRIVGVIYCNDKNLNEELLDSGIGSLSSKFCKDSEFSTHSWTQKYGC
jgi:micrococcal nuclease